MSRVSNGRASRSSAIGDTTIRPGRHFARVEISVEAGSLVILPGDAIQIQVTSRRRGRDSRLVTRSQVTDGGLRIRVGSPRLALTRNCEATVEVKVPTGTRIVASIEAGAITASGLTAGADLRSQAGTIEVHEIAGPARLSSQAGSIAGTVLGGEVNVTTSAGPIAITVVRDVTRLSARSSVGNIDLRVPDVSYRVSARTTYGRTQVGVTNQTTAPRTIRAKSEVGNVTIRPVDEGLKAPRRQP